MNFSYYNKNNEKIKLNIEVGTKWDSLNIQNQQLISVFSKVDDGDREVSKEELSLLEKLLKKADGILKSESKNDILENEELDEIVKQIDDGQIKLPKENVNVSRENVTHHHSLTKQDRDDIQKLGNTENIIDKYKAKIIKDLKKYHRYDERFPEDRYEIEIEYNGRYFESFVYKKDSKAMFQNINLIRADGIELEMKDNFDGSIDENTPNITIDQKEPTFNIIDTKGKVHTIRTIINGGQNTIQDLRIQEKAIAEFFANLPKETIQELIDKNVTDITFDTEPDEEFANLYQLDENGNCIYIYEDDTPYGTRSADIISPMFNPPKSKENQKQINKEFKINGKYEVNLDNILADSSMLQIKTPAGQIYNITLQTNADDSNLYTDSLLPRFLNIIQNLPENIITDLIHEVDNISLNKNDMLGYYNEETNSITISLYDTMRIQKLHPKITLIHELGHALDNTGSDFSSKDPVFTEKFNTFVKLAKNYEKKYSIKNEIYTTEENYEISHALLNPQEFFASVYADIGVNHADIDGNYIAKLDKIFLPFKNSNNKEEQMCYKIYIELKNDVKDTIDKIRTERR